MPESADQPAKHGRSLAGFYIAIGLVAAVVGLGIWLWTPLKIRYWEQEIHRTCLDLNAASSMGSVSYGGVPVDIAKQLVAAGPQAAPAVSRLLTSPETRRIVLQAIRDVRARWTLPLLADACQREEDRGGTLVLVITAQDITGKSFGAWWLMNDAAAENACSQFLGWWDSEGKAIYGEGAQ